MFKKKTINEKRCPRNKYAKDKGEEEEITEEKKKKSGRNKITLSELIVSHRHREAQKNEKKGFEKRKVWIFPFFFLSI